MAREVTIKLEEVKRAFDLIERLHDFFHQPMNYPQIDEFARETYPDLKEMYYDVVWNWLPDDVQREIEGD